MWCSEEMGLFPWINEDKSTGWRKRVRFSAVISTIFCCFFYSQRMNHILNEIYTLCDISHTNCPFHPHTPKSLSEFAWQNTELMRRWWTRSMKHSVSAVSIVETAAIVLCLVINAEFTLRKSFILHFARNLVHHHISL